MRELTARNIGRSLDQVVGDLGRYLNGWMGYFQIVETTTVWEELDMWIRHRLRCLIIRQRRPGSHKNWWATSLGANQEIPVAYFDSIGLPRLAKRDLKPSNRRMRTRMSGGVGGDRP